MSYEKQTWAKGDVITADKLNHMEDGIADSGVLVANLTVQEDDGKTILSLDKTYEQIEESAVCFVKSPYDDGGSLGTVLSPIIEVVNNDTFYNVVVYNFQNGQTMLMSAESADGYPESVIGD